MQFSGLNRLVYYCNLDLLVDDIHILSALFTSRQGLSVRSLSQLVRAAECLIYRKLCTLLPRQA